MAAITSGGDQSQFGINSGLNTSLTENNYLNHGQRARAEQLFDEYAKEDCSNPISSEACERIRSEIQDLKIASAGNTVEMFNACSDPSRKSDCAIYVEEARQYLDWVDNGRSQVEYINVMSRSISHMGFYDFNVHASAIDGDTSFGGDLDAVIVDAFGGISLDNGTLNPNFDSDAAIAELMDDVSTHDGVLKVVVGGVQYVGGAVTTIVAAESCAVTIGVTCVILAGAGIGNTVLGADKVAAGIAGMKYDDPARTPITNALIESGYSPEEAQAIMNNADLLLGVIEIGVGGALLIRRGATTTTTNITVADNNQGIQITQNNVATNGTVVNSYGPLNEGLLPNNAAEQS